MDERDNQADRDRDRFFREVQGYKVELHVMGHEPFSVGVPLESSDYFLGWLENLPAWIAFYIDKLAMDRSVISAKFPLLVRREAILSAEIRYETRVDPASAPAGAYRGF